jgi:hypothetical protein
MFLKEQAISWLLTQCVVSIGTRYMIYLVPIETYNTVGATMI